jgi:hypothetical protein
MASDARTFIAVIARRRPSVATLLIHAIGRRVRAQAH